MIEIVNRRTSRMSLRLREGGGMGCQYKHLWYNATLLLLFMVNLAGRTKADWWNLGLQQSLIASSAFQKDQSLNNQEAITKMCNSFDGLSEGQRQFCMLYPDHMRIIGIGAKSGIQECQRQFRDRRWNCSTVDNTTVFGGPVTKIASREAAFAYAISSAGVSFAVARACREGHLASCGCSTKPRPDNLNRDWVWAGCGDNLEYGLKLAVRFVDNPDKEYISDRKRRERAATSSTSVEARRLMNLHNNEAGRRAIQKLVTVVCSCKGLSGSCSHHTCKEQLPSFHEVGKLLKRMYEEAVEVRFVRGRHGQRLRTRDSRFEEATADDLVYIEQSPDYCETNKELNALGTHGRLCKKDSIGTDGCALMCCGRGYNKFRMTVQEKCKCRFVWCCDIKCDLCNRTVEYYACK